jgi:putative ABC transport system permease protein
MAKVFTRGWGDAEENFNFRPPELHQLWVPICFRLQGSSKREPRSHYLEVISANQVGTTALPPGAAEMTTIATRLEQQYPATPNTASARFLTPLHEHVVGNIKPALLVLLGAVAFVLLIACANVANLLLARAAVRPERGSRCALPSGQIAPRLIRQFLTDKVFCSACLGGGVGYCFRSQDWMWLKRFIPARNISQAQAIEIDAMGADFYRALMSLTHGIDLQESLRPLQPLHFNLNDTLKEGGETRAPATAQIAFAEVIGVTSEVAISFILLGPAPDC